LVARTDLSRAKRHFTTTFPPALTFPDREEPPEAEPVGLIVNEILCGELEMEFASVAVTVTVKLPDTEGAPSIVQVERTFIPAGTPEFATHVTGAVPPEVEIVCTL
jgi:hypothetical protein